MQDDTINQRHERWKLRVSIYLPLSLILFLSLFLNLWGNTWGSPNFWHPDEVTRRAMQMVWDRTLKPSRFAYGGLHYYVVAVGAVVPAGVYGRIFDPRPAGADSEARREWEKRVQARIITIARTISALMSTLVVLFTFIIGTTVFDKKVGYLAALLLAVSMSFVAIAHFATVDSSANFWYWLSCLFALLILKRGGRLWYILAAITAGFAIGTKIDRVVILFPLLLSHFLRGEKLQIRKMLLLIIPILLGYVLANPILLSSFFYFLDGFTRETFFSAMRGDPGQTSYIELLGYMKTGIGLPVLVVAAIGSAFGLYRLARGKNRATILWLFATFVPYYLLIGSNPIATVAPLWYVTLCFPALMIFAAYGSLFLIGLLPQRYTILAQSIVVAIVAYSFLHTVGMVLQFTNDSRYQASEWIERRVPANASIEMLESRGPVISRERYRMIPTRVDKEFLVGYITWRDNLDRDPTYQKVRRSILSLEKRVKHALGLPLEREPYVAWFDHIAAAYGNSPNQSEALTGIRTSLPDYVVVIDYAQPTRLFTLRSPGSGYRLATQFHFTNRLGVQPAFPFVNPRVFIYQREAPAE